MKKLILICLLIPIFSSAQVSEMPFKNAEMIIISDTNLKAWGQHLINNGFNVGSYWPEFGTFTTGYFANVKMAYAYKIHSVKTDTSIICRIFVKRNPQLITSNEEIGDFIWDYHDSSINLCKVIYDDVIKIFLQYRKKIYFAKTESGH